MAVSRQRRVTLASVDSNERLREILDQSAKLFDQRGYDRVSVEDIASASGIRKATLYHYVRSKDDILVLLHQEFMHLVLDAAEAESRQQLDPRSQLVSVMIDILALMKTHRGHVRVFFEHHRDLPTQARKGIRADRDRYEKIVEAIIARGISTGQFRQVDVRLSTLGIFGMCNWAYQWYKPSGPMSPEVIARFFASCIVDGIGKR